MFIVAYFPTKKKEDFTMKKIKNMTDAEAKQAREYRCNIARMVYDIESLDTIESIYSFIMGMLSAEKGGGTDE
ncbi:hypothetical protein D7X87_20730 [bacterium D16-54]|nr:hypothetical protein D7X87_20730 [bacterium D16-54]RKJ11480.1 hypothetical protein D7X65_21165 [bacterium D16-56]